MSKIKIQTAFCEAGSPAAKKNEDRMIFGPNFVCVIDGATGVHGRNVTDDHTDAEWFARRVSEELTKDLPDTSRSIQEILQGVTAKLGHEYSDFCSKYPDDKPASASAAIVIFRIVDGRYLECYRLADCLGIVRCKNGRIAVLEETRLTELDRKHPIKVVEEAKRTGKPVRECRYVVERDLSVQRDHMHHWYKVLDTSGVDIPYGEYHRFHLADIESFSAMSDGFSNVVNIYGIVEDYKALHEALVDGRATEMVYKMHEAQKSDPDWDKYPRLKNNDDTTVVTAAIV